MVGGDHVPAEVASVSKKFPFIFEGANPQEGLKFEEKQLTFADFTARILSVDKFCHL